MAADIRSVDPKGRITLPPGWANSTVQIEAVSEYAVVIRKVKVLPLGDDLPPLPHVQPLSDEDRQKFLAAIDNPPEPNAALRKLMGGGDAQD